MSEIDEFESGAAPYKVGKRVGRGAKVKNATKITADGHEFDSKLEYNCYKILKEFGVDFIFKPDKIQIVPDFETVVLDHTPENLKKLAALKREWSPSDKYIKDHNMDKGMAKLYKAECKRMQSSILRKFNAEHRMELYVQKVRGVTWSPDFLLPEYNLYVEAKGFANDSFPIKFKHARWTLGMGVYITSMGQHKIDEMSAVEVGSNKELNDLIIFLKTKR